MQHIDTIRQLGDTEHAVFKPSSNSQLVDTRTHGRHGFPVSWFESLLDQVQSVTGNLPGISWESANILETRSNQKMVFLGIEVIYKYLYEPSSLGFT
jgi:hypothetical protein